MRMVEVKSMHEECNGAEMRQEVGIMLDFESRRVKLGRNGEE